MQKITLARNAMATRFEFVLRGENPTQLRAAGEEAFTEIERIEAQLSLYRPASEIAEINRGASYRPVRVSPSTYLIIENARAFWELSAGSFDITVAPLVRSWGFMQGNGARPTNAQIAEALEVVGTQYLELDADASTVRFKRAGMMIDLGSIGKGYALDCAAEILRDAGVEHALLHGGTSTIYGLGRDDTAPWRVALDEPLLPSVNPSRKNAAPSTLAIIELENQALSVSAVWGKFFILDGKTYGHVIDPRTGWPAPNALLGCAVVELAAASDALSTAVLLGTKSEMDTLAEKLPELSFLQASLSESGEIGCRHHGIEITENDEPKPSDTRSRKQK